MELSDNVGYITIVAPEVTTEAVCGTDDFPLPVGCTNNKPSEAKSPVIICSITGMISDWKLLGDRPPNFLHRLFCNGRIHVCEYFD